MNAQSPSEPSREEMETRRKVWERVKEKAQAVHRHPQEHGINSKIATDAGRSPQTVGDWKHGRTPIPPSVLATLAAKYEVSVRYLACMTDDPNPNAPTDEAELRARALEHVEDAIGRAQVTVDGLTGAKMYSLALDMLRQGTPGDSILGKLIYVAEGREDREARIEPTEDS